MSGVNVSVSGQQELQRALGRLRDEARQELEAALESEAEEVAQDARGNVRVASGDLQSTITPEVDGLMANVRPREELSQVSAQQHAIKANVNEFGRASDPGQPYMVPAAEASRQRWPNRAREAVKNAAK